MFLLIIGRFGLLYVCSEGGISLNSNVCILPLIWELLSGANPFLLVFMLLFFPVKIEGGNIVVVAHCSRFMSQS